MPAKLNEEDRRKHTIRIRVTDSELAAINDRYGEKSTSTTIRNYLLTSELPRRSAKPHPDVLRGLAYIGNNINQIARAANSTKGRALDKIEVLAALAELRDQIGELRK